jgi:hypothetical protein
MSPRTTPRSKLKLKILFKNTKVSSKTKCRTNHKKQNILGIPDKISFIIQNLNE